MDMKEIEVKILEINLAETVRKIEEAGGTKTYEGEVLTTYYDSGKELDRKGQVLRLRRKDGRTEITFKEKISQSEISQRDFKSMNEIETTVGDYQTMDTILQAIGYKPYRKLNKRRTSYSIIDIRGNVHFDIDTYTGFPTFLEIEAESEVVVRDWVLRLGHTMKDAKPWTTSDVFKHYGKKM